MKTSNSSPTLMSTLLIIFALFCAVAVVFTLITSTSLIAQEVALGIAIVAFIGFAGYALWMLQHNSDDIV